VWVGNFDGTPLTGSSGVAGAGPIFQAAMLAAVEHAGRDIHDAAPILARPDDVERREICLVSGMTAGAACARRGLEWTAGRARARCTWHVRQDGEVVTRWPEKYRRWAAAEGHQVTPRPAKTSAATAGLRIMTPQADAVYLIDPTLRAEFQTLPLAADGAVGRVQWSINGREAGSADASSPLHWPLTPGRHTIVARDERGRTARTTFLVK
jgi:penicillin-binding protein 1C